MKGIILAGGSGTRLYPLTKSVSKQILPIYDKPMIYYPLSILMLAGINEVLIISTPRDLPGFQELLGDGSRLGCHFDYTVQEKPNGLAEAFILGEKFIGNDDVALILGDNIFYGNNLPRILRDAITELSTNGGASIFGYYVHNPTAYGVVEFDRQQNVLSIEEKPVSPKSNYAIPGLYFYDNSVIEVAKNVKPSSRSELEISSVNNWYLAHNKLKVQLLGRGMTWLDTGSYDGLLEASNFVATIQKRQGMFVSCVEEIAYRRGWIPLERLLDFSQEFNNFYGDYLKMLYELESPN